MTSFMPRDGVPLESEYRALLGSRLFKEMESYSDDFLQLQGNALGEYTSRWVGDPLHQWSRQWEYPYVYSRLLSLLEQRSDAVILDAGSGVTFFPYYLLARSDASLHCCDYDARLEEVYDRINRKSGKAASFRQGDLRDMPYPAESFDALYCVSVLEHTREYEKIIEEFHRVLKPGGLAVLTFDISLDGTRDIGVEKANVLLGALASRFSKGRSFCDDLSPLISAPGILTTMGAKAISPDSLPWKLPGFLYQAKALLRTRRIIPWPPKLSVFCLTLEK